jgi:hypothetical protein
MVMEPGVSDSLACIVSGVGSELETMEVATIRVPTFGTNMQSPLNGYRSFGGLPSINVKLEVPSHAGSGFNCELLAARGGDNPDIREFMDTWSPYGVALETHFILIFSPLPDNGPRVSTFNPNIPSGHQSCYSSIEGQSVPSPPFTTPVSVAWLRGLPNVFHDITRTNSPASNIGSDYQQLSDPGRAVTETTPSQKVTKLVPGTPIETVCTRYGITNDVFHSAKFLTTEKLLVKMVRNYKCMLHILECIGLQEHNASFVSSRTVTFAGGLMLSAGDVVKHFGWAVELFKHKSVWYGWAEEVVRSREWVGAPPSELYDRARPFTCILTLALPCSR